MAADKSTTGGIATEGPFKPTYEKVDEFGAHAKTDPKEIALVRKLDLHILPILWLMYLFNYLDRNALVNARLNDLEKELNLQGTQYNTCVSILFVGYIAGQIPSNMVLNRVRPSWYMAGFCMAWSIVSLLTFLAKDYSTMVVLRFFLGVTEAPFYPGALYLISLFYTRKEIATRMSWFFTANMLASAFSPLIAAGVFSGLDKSMGLSGWKWLFIIQGALSIVTAVLAFFMLPDHPLKTRWLNEEEKQYAHNRICVDTTDLREGTSVWVGLKEACSDWRMWVLCLMYNFHLSSISFQNFLPTVIETLGYGRIISLVLTSGHFNERTWHITTCKCIVIVGFVLAVATLNIPARMVGIFLFVGFTFGINNIILGWVSSTLGQTNEKKSVALAIANSLGNMSSIYMPYIWPKSDGPRYLPAWMASIAFSAGCMTLAWVLKIALRRQNKKMRAANPNETNFYVY
uniref:Major facilitator superfamily (MFS) profile domain-containing protein n=1 Tax=Bionectria ochroleuca TaxID=29856 RepID=A0A8H7NQB4_BIOOC